MTIEQRILGYILATIGGVLAFSGLVWGYGGYYAEDAYKLVGLLFTGAALLGLGNHLIQKAKAAETRARDRNRMRD